MEDQFYKIYTDLYSQYIAASQIARPGVYTDGWIGIVTDALDRGIAQTELASRMRPDAMYFLLVNLNEMIAKPASRSQRARTEAPDLLQQSMQADVATIVSDAASRVSNRTGEIGGREIVESLARVYAKLRTVNWDIWG
jgi:hypothetical protein